MTGEEMTEILVRFARRIGRFRAHHPRPFLAKIERDGGVTLIEDFERGWRARYTGRRGGRRK